MDYEEEIKAGLDEFIEGVPTGSNETAWTKGIKEKIAEIGKFHGLFVKTSDIDKNKKDWGEWLYDMAWVRYRDQEEGKKHQHPILEEIVLALEYEWGGNGDVIDDFEKLLVSRAQLRVMIFDTFNGVTLDLIDELIERIHAYSGTEKGDRYLFSCWDVEEQRFVHRKYTVPRVFKKTNTAPPIVLKSPLQQLADDDLGGVFSNDRGGIKEL